MKKILALALFSVLAASPAVAQTPPPQAPPGQGGAAPKVVQPLDKVFQRPITAEFRAARLREVMTVLFSKVDAEVWLSPVLPDAKITLKASDEPFLDVFQRVLDAASTAQAKLVFQIETDGTRPRFVVTSEARDEATEPLFDETLMLAHVRASDMLKDLKTLGLPTKRLDAVDASNTLLITATRLQLSRLREMIRLLDIVPRQVTIKAEVVMVDATTDRKNQSSLLALNVGTPNNKPATTTEKIAGSPARMSSLTATFTPHIFGDGQIGVDMKIDLSFPLTTGVKGEVLRLEKTIDSFKRFPAGETIAVGGTTLSQYGLKGQILIFVTVTADPKK